MKRVSRYRLIICSPINNKCLEMTRQKSVDATNAPITPTNAEPAKNPIATLPKHVRKHIRELNRPRSTDRAGPSSPRASEDVETAVGVHPK